MKNAVDKYNTVIFDGKTALFLAKIFDVKPNWKLSKIKNGFVAYDGNKFCIFESKQDYERMKHENQ